MATALQMWICKAFDCGFRTPQYKCTKAASLVREAAFGLFILRGHVLPLPFMIQV